jgi:gliding motility-associated lipoprotein GldH
MKRANLFTVFFISMLLFIMNGCHTDNLVDTNEEMAQRNWSYVNKIKAVVDITDQARAYNMRFKLRHTADYRYSNIFILMHLSVAGQPKVTRRYEYKLAEADGQWLGNGSGNLYDYSLPLLTGYHFPKAGIYTIEIEQNMRDNPLTEISDAGITVAEISQ